MLTESAKTTDKAFQKSKTSLKRFRGISYKDPHPKCRNAFSALGDSVSSNSGLLL